MKKNIALAFCSILLISSYLGLNGQDLKNENSVLILDSSTPSPKMLLKGLAPGTLIAYTDITIDPLLSIDKIVKENAPIKSLHIFTNGKPGVLIFSQKEIDKNMIEQHVKMLERWKQYFPDGGDILLYGCDVGKGLEGANFINTLSSVTGVDIAASNNTTGSPLIGADWNLELSIGEIEATAVLNKAVLLNYPSILGK